MNKIFKSSFLVFFLLTLHALAVEDSIFDIIKKDKDGVDAIRSFVKSDPLSLESIYSGGQTGTTIYTGGQTPLIHAVLQGKFHAVQTLLELGANVFATEKDGYNVLHAAGYQGRAEILQLLIDHFSHNAIDMDVATDQHNDGYYPLHRACWGRSPRHAETVRVFLNNGVPHDLKSRDGKSCAQMTKNEGTLAVLREVVENAHTTSSEL